MSCRRTRLDRAFTIVELLVVVSIIGVLMALLLPAVGRARSGSRAAVSAANLHQLGIAAAAYAGDWDGRQMTLAIDSIASYGNDAASAAAAYKQDGPTGEFPPGILLGWSTRPNGNTSLEAYYISPANPSNYPWMQPIVFDQSSNQLGWYRVPNARPMQQYLSSRFYDPVFYAPADDVVMDQFRIVEPYPGEYTHTQTQGLNWNKPCWSSYCLSPAALMSPSVMRQPSQGGFQDPWSLPAGFRAPSLDQAKYPSLKTHILEHHWLQNRRQPCNVQSPRSSYEGCEPYYFNHSWDSAPQAVFYDGHVGEIGARAAQRLDARVQEQTGGDVLWLRDTPFGPTGYFGDVAYDDDVLTSFHILTAEGIRGRDTLSAP
jgi:prepilin-type N-terminal cleavage/methylation domain-containing protein